MTRPAPIRFTDLAHPVYPEAAQPFRDGLTAYGATVQLEPEALLQAAVDRTGLTDLGDPAFRERLGVLCSSLREETGLCVRGAPRFSGDALFAAHQGSALGITATTAAVAAGTRIDDRACGGTESKDGKEGELGQGLHGRSSRELMGRRKVSPPTRNGSMTGRYWRAP